MSSLKICQHIQNNSQGRNVCWLTTDCLVTPQRSATQYLLLLLFLPLLLLIILLLLLFLLLLLLFLLLLPTSHSSSAPFPWPSHMSSFPCRHRNSSYTQATCAQTYRLVIHKSTDQICTNLQTCDAQTNRLIMHKHKDFLCTNPVTCHSQQIQTYHAQR